ncbi:carbohydrate ABC transporter permease [Nocardiopsis gilva YIM 90087]|uniref:Carbohydrate ABC transporter permease n=1 Tax=Nocardiopsis gilva YIM 90087 TaxID=1235441 RepID=A0A223SE08_9ACTN|nr:carbohydrate ABC transporter permease [Nocardiopsis gilva]ASU86355.1 carbohydrate ABC transporter permease [Nocardiopsis gilva YIM 90087]
MPVSSDAPRLRPARGCTPVRPFRPFQRHPAHDGASRREVGPLTYLALTLAVLFSAFPLYWMFVVATRGNAAIAQRPPAIAPGGEFAENVVRTLENPQANFALGLVNSAIVASVTAVSVVLFCSLAGFALAKLRFTGRNAITLGVVLTMMVPVQMAVVPMLIMMDAFDWRGDLKAVIVPFMVTGFGVFMMRQYALQGVPTELLEAARIDGCSMFRAFWSVVLPALRPPMVVLGLLTFMQNWNEFIWPIAVLGPDNPTVQVSIHQLNSGYTTDFALMFTGAAFATLPLLLVFVLFGRRLIGGIMEGAVKG